MPTFHRFILIVIAFLSVTNGYIGFCNKLQRWLLLHRISENPNLGPLFHQLLEIGFIKKIRDVDIILIFSMALMLFVTRYALIAISSNNPSRTVEGKMSIICLCHTVLMVFIVTYLFKDGELQILLPMAKSFFNIDELRIEAQNLKLLLFLSCLLIEAVISGLISVCITMMAVDEFLQNFSKFQLLSTVEPTSEEETRRQMMAETHVF